MTTPDRKHTMFRFIDEMESIGDAETMLASTGCIVVVFDPVCDSRSYHGPFPHGLLVDFYADIFRAELNEGIGDDPPYEVQVELLQPPEQDLIDRVSDRASEESQAQHERLMTTLGDALERARERREPTNDRD